MTDTDACGLTESPVKEAEMAWNRVETWMTASLPILECFGCVSPNYRVETSVKTPKRTNVEVVLSGKSPLKLRPFKVKAIISLLSNLFTVETSDVAENGFIQLLLHVSFFPWNLGPPLQEGRTRKLY